jgi:hypothetical protein
MATPQPIPEASPAASIPESDDIDLTNPAMTFNSTLFGKLPNELLENVARYLFPNDLAAIARVAQRLREVTERLMYKSIEAPYSHIYNGYFSEQSLPEQQWLLCRTLSDRKDLAEKVRRIRFIVRDHTHQVEIPSTNVFPGILAYTPSVPVLMSEATAVGMLLQRLSKVEHLDLGMIQYYDDEDSNFEDAMNIWMYTHRARLICSSIRKLFPGFDENTAHSIDPPLLPKLNYLLWCGDQFHWALAKSPHLETLVIDRPCTFLPDAAPNELSTSLRVMKAESRSTILNPSTTQHESFSRFLEHFPFLRELTLNIHDARWDVTHSDREADINGQNQGSFAVLLRLLQPVKSSVTGLSVEIGSGGSDESSNYLRFVLPCDGFKAFTSLEFLGVPYQALFGPVDPQWSHISPPLSGLLPSTLVRLFISFPRIEVLDWIAQLQFYRDELPALSVVSLSCGSVQGDSYEVFAFISHPHPARTILASLEITLVISNTYDDDDPVWDDYDLALFDNFFWFGSFGSPCLGTMIHPLSFNLQYKLIQRRHRSQKRRKQGCCCSGGGEQKPYLLRNALAKPYHRLEEGGEVEEYLKG